MSQKNGRGSDQNSKMPTAVKLSPRHTRPKILLIDIDPSATELLQVAGYNVSNGSFGKLYRVQKSDGITPVIANGNLPEHFTEQDIVIIDLAVKSEEILPYTQGEKATSPRQNDWWASMSSGIVDPRPRLMAMVQDDMERILAHRGLFIVFTSPRIKQTLKWGHIVHQNFIEEKTLDYDNWCFLKLFQGLDIEPDSGQEITVIEDDFTLIQCLRSHINDAHFDCTLQPKWSDVKKAWISLATNKYGDDVASTLILGEEKKRGFVFLFPQLQDKSHFIAQLIQEVLPELAPHLFPDVEGTKWVQRQEYELPKILQLKAEIQQIQTEMENRITALHSAIATERVDMAFLHSLLTASGEPLVMAVQHALKLLGFQSVVNVDEEMAKKAETSSKREDLQIHDRSPVVLVEVKGLSGLPKDAAALQVWKYFAPRMKEWNRIDVRGLSIINHQRNLPALERDNSKLFRDDLIINAEEHDFGLMTTWDLFRLVRSYLKYNWSPRCVMDLFYQNGRIEPVPGHYEFAGEVEKLWPAVGAIGVRTIGGGIACGDRIAFELAVEFEEQDVTSLQVDKEPVNKVEAGQLAGIKTALTKDQVKVGARVFIVRSLGST